MTDARKFLFDRDFRETAARRITEADLAAAEESGFARGLATGRSHADNAIEARIADALERLAAGAGHLLAEAESRRAAEERAMVQLALTFAKAIGGAAIARAPLAPIAEAAQACFAHLDGVPHLVARVHEDLVEETQRVVERIAHERGFAGRLVVIGDPEIAPGDALFDWADGGVARDAQAVETAVTRRLPPWAADPGNLR